MKILITGASGFIGKELVSLLKENNNEIFGLTRNIEAAQSKIADIIWISWPDSRQVIDLKAYGSFDVVINLVGENIAGNRWSSEQKKILYNSRIDSTDTLLKMIKQSQGIVPTFISTSAIGIYGDRQEEEIHENSLVVDDFIGKLCQDWEQVVYKHKDTYERCCIIRTGLVLGKNGGMMEKLLPLFKLGLGGKLSNGNFYMSWIHIKDLCRIYLKAIQDTQMKGVYNATAPYPEKNKIFTQKLASLLRRPAFFSVPKFTLKIIMGELADHATQGAKITPKKLRDENFHFHFPTLDLALKDVLSKQ